MPKVLIPADTTTGYIGTASGIKSLGLSVGLTGAISASRYAGATASGAPSTGTFIAGDFVIDLTGAQWVCTAGGTPGTWAKIASVGATAAGASAVGDTAGAGSGGTAARVDHVHGREAFAAPSALTVSQAQSSGTAVSISRSDHQHAMPGSAVVGAVTGGATASAGSAATLALSDHVHSTSNLALLDTANTFTTSLTVSAGSVTAPAVSISGLTGAAAASRYVGATASGAPASGTFLVGDFTIDQTGKIWVCTTAGTVGSGAVFTSASGTAVSYATPGSSAVGDSAGAGSATSVSRSDHVHGREAFGGSTTTLSFPTTGAIGTAVTLARSDHTHTLGTPVTSIVAGTGISVSGATGAVTVTNSSPGPTQVTFAESTTSPNATTYVDSITVAGSTTNVDLALVPKGYGSLMAQVPDGTAAGGNKRGTNAVDWQTSGRSSGYAVASGGNSVIAGGYGNTANMAYATVGGGDANIAGSITAGGGIAGLWSTVAGGRSNHAREGDYATVGGGYGNASRGFCSTVGGGQTNWTGNLVQWATISGGNSNVASGQYSTVAGGRSNAASTSDYTTVGGGYTNTASADSSTISGGYTNTASANSSTIPGGRDALASTYGKMAYASGKSSVQGDAQYGLSVLRGDTTEGTVGPFTGSFSGFVLTVTAMPAKGLLRPGMVLAGDIGVPSGARIISQITGTSGSTGTYNTSVTGTLSSKTTLTGTQQATQPWSCTGSISGTTLTVTAVASGNPMFYPGDGDYRTGSYGTLVTGTGITASTRISAVLTLTGNGGVGTYTVDTSSSATGSIAITGSATMPICRTTLTADGTGTPGAINVVNLRPNTAYLAKMMIVGTDTTVPSTGGVVYEYTALYRQGAAAANTVLADYTQLTALADSAFSDADVTIQADATNGGMRIYCYGTLTRSMRWTANVHTTEVG